MDSIIIGHAGTALASTPERSWLRMPTSAAAASASTRPVVRPLPEVSRYDVRTVLGGTAVDHAAQAVIDGMTANRKFSTRTGPSPASPPV